MRTNLGFDSRKSMVLGAALTAVMAGSDRTWALVVPLTNPDFEADAAADPNGQNPNKTGWGNPFDGFGVRISGSLDPGGLAGSPFVGENNYLQLKADSNPGGALGGVSFVAGSQTVTTIQPDAIYTLSVTVANSGGTPFPTNIPANDTYPANFNDGNPITLSRLINSTTGTGLGQTAGVTIVSNNAGPVAPNSQASWKIEYETNSAPANLNGAVAIQFFVQSNTAGGLQEALFDNVSLTLLHKRFWDINGTAAGAGGATPSGNWNGSTVNFNSNSAGGAGGTTTATTTADDKVIFTAGTDGTGSYTVNVSGTQTADNIQIARGSVTLAGGTIAAGLFDVSAGATSTVSSTVTGGSTGSLTKTGPGTLTLTGTNSYTGGTVVQAGKLVVNRLHENNAVIITGGTVQVAESAPNYASGHPSGDNAFVSTPSALLIGGTGPLGTRVYAGKLDLTNNDLIIDYTGASPILNIEDMVRAGFNGGDFLGNGITTSIGEIDNSFILAVADNASLAAPFGTANGGALFSGVDVDLTTVLVKFTHRVDLNLDGVVTPADATIFGTNFDPGQPATWATGDLDYNGVFTPNDATIFGTFYDPTLASLPEPGSLALLGLLSVGLARRPRGN